MEDQPTGFAESPKNLVMSTILGILVVIAIVGGGLYILRSRSQNQENQAAVAPVTPLPQPAQTLAPTPSVLPLSGVSQLPQTGSPLLGMFIFSLVVLGSGIALRRVSKV